jgi:hypothetical protein
MKILDHSAHRQPECDSRKLVGEQTDLYCPLALCKYLFLAFGGRLSLLRR